MTLYIGDKAKNLPAYYHVIGCPTSIAGGAVSASVSAVSVRNVNDGRVFRRHRMEISDPSMNRKDLYKVRFAVTHTRRFVTRQPLGDVVRAPFHSSAVQCRVCGTTRGSVGTPT